MTDIAGNRFRKPQLRQPPGAHGLSRLPLVAIAVVALHRRRPGGLPALAALARRGRRAPDAPSLPITVAGVAFNVPPAAIRIPVQRRPGAHERVDLAFLWPSLEPPDPHAKVAPAATNGEPAAGADDRSPVRDARGRDRPACAGRPRARDLHALRRTRSDPRSARPADAAVSRRQPLSGRRPDLRDAGQRWLSGPLHAQRPRPHARHLPLRAADRARRHRRCAFRATGSTTGKRWRGRSTG